MEIFRFMSIDEFRNYLNGKKIEGRFVKGKACFLEENIPARELDPSIKQITDITSLDFKTNNFEEQVEELNELISSDFKDGDFKGELKEFKNLTLADFMSKVRKNASAEVLVKFATTEEFEKNCEKLILPYEKYLIEELQVDNYSMEDLKCISYKIDLINRFKNGVGIDTIPENEFKDVEQTLEDLEKAEGVKNIDKGEITEEKLPQRLGEETLVEQEDTFGKSKIEGELDQQIENESIQKEF